MIRRHSSRFRPGHDPLEPRCLLSTAVVDIRNNSQNAITFRFRWSATSAWATDTEAPGQSELIATTATGKLRPQVLYDRTASPRSRTKAMLKAGYGVWDGSGPPPASAATDYQFANVNARRVAFGYLATPPPAPAPILITIPTPTSTSTPGTTSITTPTSTSTSTSTPTPTSTLPANPDATQSANWSGYAAATDLNDPQSGSVTAVGGSWIVPTATATSARGTTYSSVWVGIDGLVSSTVEQIGTEQDVVNGTPVYSAWWEMYSSGTRQPAQTIAGMTIAPGDAITASVQYIGSGVHAGDFQLSITDNSRSNDTSTTYVASSQYQNPAAQRDSAEWIVEAPSLGNSVAALADFGGVTFTGASATIDGVTGPINDASWQSRAMDIAAGGVVEATTSVLAASGTSFAVTYDATTGSSGSGPIGRWWGASRRGSAAAASGSSSSASASSSSSSSSVIPAFYGTTPPSRKPPFGSARGLLAPWG